MVNPKSVYYTFRMVSGDPLTVQAKKWDDMVSEEEPVETYNVKPENSGIFACSCPAYRECKHLKTVRDAIATGKIDNLWEWKWTERGGWTKLDDIKPIEDWEL